MPYLNDAISELIKAQAYQNGNHPDALRNAEEFSCFTLPLVALSTMAVSIIS